jgi:hypothetical protein
MLLVNPQYTGMGLALSFHRMVRHELVGRAVSPTTDQVELRGIVLRRNAIVTE